MPIAAKTANTLENLRMALQDFKRQDGPSPKWGGGFKNKYSN